MRKFVIPQPNEQTISTLISSVIVSLPTEPPLVQQELVSAQLQQNTSPSQISVLPEPSVTHQNSLAARRAAQANTKPKRYHKWKPSYLIDYKWLHKVENILYCKCCSKFPQYTDKRVEFVKGWAGTAEGYKEEMLERHEKYHSEEKHKKCAEAWEKLGLSMTNSIAPGVETWSSKLSKATNEELFCKFVASNLLGTEGFSDKKYKAVLESFELVGAKVGTTHRNKRGCAIFQALEADLIHEEHTQELVDARFLSLQGDGGHDKSRKAQEATNCRIVGKNTEMPKILGLGYSILDKQDASAKRKAMFSILEHHGVSKDDAFFKLCGLTADGAGVNMGRCKGMKALIQKKSGAPGNDSDLEYWGWFWVLILWCINHLLELGIKDLKNVDPYILEFDEQLKKVFTVYYYSSVMESERGQIAALTDDDFTTLGGLQQIRWSPSQHRAISKLDKNFRNLTQHLESVAANPKHERKEECEGVLGYLTSLKFLKMLMFVLDMHSICQFISITTESFPCIRKFMWRQM